jgi:hypothetical protein
MQTTRHDEQRWIQSLGQTSHGSRRAGSVAALAVFALMDLERSANLRALADGVPFRSMSFELPAIAEKVVNRQETFQSLEYALQSRANLPGPPSAAQVELGLRRLVDKNLVAKENSGYRLNSQLSHFAGRLPIIDNVLIVESVSLNQDNEPVVANFTALQSGVNDILYFENLNEETIVRSITGMQVVGLVAKFLNEPDTFNPPRTTGPSPRVVRPTTAAAVTYCGQCGSPLTSGTMFCPNCGSKVSS